MKIACPKGLQPALGQAIITGENREKPIDNICPPKSRWLKNKKKNFLSEREKVGEEKGVCGGVWECGKPERFSIISMPRSEGEKGRTFSLSRLWRRSLASLFPLPARRRSPPQRIFFFASFFFWRCLYETTEETGNKTGKQ